MGLAQVATDSAAGTGPRFRAGGPRGVPLPVDGIFAAYRATNGKALWQFDPGVDIAAGPITYAVGDRQFVAVLSGPPALYSDAASHTGPNRVLEFTLGGTAKLPPPPAPRDPIPAPNVKIVATTTELAEGGALFTAYCSRCHSFTSNLVKGGAVPDLRRTTTAVHATFDSIAICGARRALGMPSFAKDLNAAQVRPIQAYVVDEAERASNASRVRP